MHALLRARNAGTASPVAFRVACERKRSMAQLTLDDGFINRDGDDAGPTCFDLDSVEKRYLLVGVIDGGARVYDTERFDGGDGAKKYELVCVVEGAGHFELVAPWTEPFERFWPSVTAFLGRVSATAPSQSPSTEFQ